MTYRRPVLTFTVLSCVAAIACAHGGCSIATAPTTADAAASDGATVDVSAIDGGGGVDRGECTDYTPSRIDGRKAGTFSSADEVVTIDLPRTDVGGGLLRVTIRAETQPLEVGVWLPDGEKRDEQRTEGGAEKGQTSTFTARLGGGLTYQLRAYPLDYRSDGTNGYALEYSYTPLVDCYEGNDTRATAKRIPLNVPVEAHLHPGIGPHDGRLVGPTAEDWYWFDLTEPKKVSLSIRVPGDNTAYFRLLDGNDREVACDDPNFGIGMSATETQESFRSCTGPLGAGRYWVQAGLGNSEYPSTDPDAPVPVSWKEPYTLTVEAN